MQLYDLDSLDYILLENANKVLELKHVPDKRFIVSSLSTETGNIISSINLRAYLGRASVCAEPIALSRMLDEENSKPSTLVALCYPGFVTTPCGICRELLIDYCPNLKVIINTETGLKKCLVTDLMPMKFYGTKKDCFNKKPS